MTGGVTKTGLTDISTWIKTKNDLIKLQAYPWLPILYGNGSTLDDVIFSAVTTASTATNHYDPYRVEQLLADVSRLLDRTFSYRKQGYDLDIAATTWALDYQLFEDQLARQVALEQQTYVGTQRQIERDAQGKALAAFGAATNDALAPGFMEVASGNHDSCAVAADGETGRQGLVQAKWDRLQQYQTDLQGRHTFPGGSLNYAERLGRLQKLLVEDVVEAYQKAFAAQLGLKAVFGIDLAGTPTPFPAPDIGFLDGLLSWTRQAIRQLEIDQQDDVEFEHIVFLVQPRGDNKISGVTSPTQYANDMSPGGTGVLNVDLTHYFDSAPLGRIWLRGVGMSTSHQYPFVPEQSLFRLSAQVFPPSVTNLFDSSGSPVPRSPMILTNIAITDPAIPVQMLRGANLNNVDPRGLWTIIVNDTIGFPNNGNLTRNAGHITDIKLHLQLCARPQKSADSWKGQLW
jgi:hypothetical protein